LVNAITVTNLTKNFSNVKALNQISFDVRENEIFGLIGPNGAGKTTTLRILGTLINPSSGKTEIFGYDVMKQSDQVRKIISYLPEEAGAYQQLNGYEYLHFMAGFYASNKEKESEIVKRAEEISGLNDRLNDRIKGYSKGMNRRLLLARALMMQPRLAILDEPTSGLDVIHAYHVRETIKNYVDRFGVTVLLSSHNMLEVEHLCHRVALIDKGIIVAEGSPKQLVAEHNVENLEQVFMEVAQPA
jgi:ABC-2 type transport system ATP-binding protein